MTQGKPSGVAAAQAMATDIGRTPGDRLLRDNEGWVEVSPHTAIRALQEEVDRLRAERRWIAVSERLPEQDEDVLVMAAEGKFASGGMHVASLDEDGVWYPSHGDGWEFPDVTHWMPLPEPPESSE